MTADALLTSLLAVQGALGGFDTLVNHEMLDHLPRRSSARTEVGLHSLRELLYAPVFAGAGWFAWHGATAIILAVLLLGELLVSTADELVENRTRVLPPNERALHIFLTLNLGLIFAVAVPLLLGWYAQPTALVVREAGILTGILSALAVLALGWSARDFIAWLQLRGHLRSVGRQA